MRDLMFSIYFGFCATGHLHGVEAEDVVHDEVASSRERQQEEALREHHWRIDVSINLQTEIDNRAQTIRLPVTKMKIPFPAVIWASRVPMLCFRF